MRESEVRIVRLEPATMVRASAFGTSPEADAWRKLLKWAECRNLFKSGKSPRIFGFNNPDPSPGNPEYGYELWMEAGRESTSGDGLDVSDFAGGMFAVARCEDLTQITATWMRLVEYVRSSNAGFGAGPLLEESLNPPHSVAEFEAMRPEQMRMDLYCPIAAEKA